MKIDNIIIVIDIIVAVIFGILILGLSWIIYNDISSPSNSEFINCCDGSPCTDTYYTYEDNLCHLVLCENSLFTNKLSCVYKGKNISGLKNE